MIKKMSTRPKACATVIIVITLLLVYPKFVCGSLEEELNRLNELKEKLRQERVDRVNDKVDNYNRLKSLEMRIYSLEDELTGVQARRIDIEKKFDILTIEKDELQDEYDEIEKMIEGIKEFLAERTEELKERIGEGFPYRKEERLKEVNSLTEIIQSKGSDLLQEVDALFKILLSEVLLVENCDYYSQEIEGKKTKIFKVGGIFSAYMSNDGTIGILQKRIKKEKLDYIWREDIKSSIKEKLRDLFQSIESKERSLNLPLDVIQGTKIKKEVSGTGIVSWLLKGGPVMIPILAVAIAILVMVLERLFTYRKEHIDSDTLMDNMMRLWNRGDKQSAIRLCETTPGPVARMLRTGLLHHEKGKDKVEQSVHEASLSELPKLEKHLSAIGVLAAVAPLLGLLGTVSGMINTFKVITYYGGGDPRLLAGGISEALITTEAGLIIAIPALLLHNYLSNKANRITTDIEKNAVKLINSLA